LFVHRREKKRRESGRIFPTRRSARRASSRRASSRHPKTLRAVLESEPAEFPEKK